MDKKDQNYINILTDSISVTRNKNISKSQVSNNNNTSLNPKVPSQMRGNNIYLKAHLGS